MGTTTFLDLLLYLKKRAGLIALFVLVGVLAAFVVARQTQAYTATVGIQYTYEGAGEGLDPLGGKLDVYEVMDPSLIAQALQNMGSDLSIEEVRNQLSVTPVLNEKEQKAQEAKIELGELVAVSTDTYNVSYTCKGSLGSAFAQRFLYNLLECYDEYFSRKYLNRQLVSDFMGILNAEETDYMEICDYIDGQLTSINTVLDNLVEKDADFTSLSTGLDFAALRSLYFNLRSNQYDSLYATVRNGLLTKDKDLLLKGYQKRLEDMALEAQNKLDEAEQAHEMVSLFYEQYKKNNLYYQARSTQMEGGSDSDDNKNIVYDHDLSKMINTYDDMLLRYVDAGVAASTLTRDSEYYTQLMQEFSADTASAQSKRPLIEATEALIGEISNLSSQYAVLANQTLGDYYDAMVAQNLKYMMAVEVTPTVSTSAYLLLGFFIMLLMGSAAAVMVEVVRAQMLRRQLERAQAEGELGITPEVIEAMTPLERSFYDQAQNGFDEFYLEYQPIVQAGRWEVAETLVRWRSKRLGRVTPDEFIPVAERFGLLNQLGEWIFTKACKQSMAWQEQGVVSPCVSVNYAVQQIESQDFIDAVCRIISQTKVNPHNIILEISGGGELRDIGVTSAKLMALKGFGLRLALDKFGDAMASLRTLYDLPVDMVKLDRCFLDSLGNIEDKHTALFYQIVTACRELHLHICMCGIEEEWQMEKVTSLGVEYVQGFYFSSPLSVTDYENRYRAQVQAEQGGASSTKEGANHA